MVRRVAARIWIVHAERNDTSDPLDDPNLTPYTDDDNRCWWYWFLRRGTGSERSRHVRPRPRFRYSATDDADDNGAPERSRRLVYGTTRKQTRTTIPSTTVHRHTVRSRAESGCVRSSSSSNDPRRNRLLSARVTFSIASAISSGRYSRGEWYDACLFPVRTASTRTESFGFAPGPILLQPATRSNHGHS